MPDQELPTFNANTFSNTSYTAGSTGTLVAGTSTTEIPVAVTPSGVKYISIEDTEMPKNGLRVVQVYIADTDEKVPMDKRVLFESERKVTDSTDQELFYELDILAILGEHNKYRETVENEEWMKGEVVRYLKPIKIRNLTMTVVTLAEF